MSITPRPGLHPADLTVRALPEKDLKANWSGYLPFDGYLTPPQIAKAYNMPASTGAGVKVAIIAPLGGGFLQTDLAKDFTDLKANGYFPSSQAVPVIKKVFLDGTTGSFANDPYQANMENTLDIYCVATMAPSADITIYFCYDFGGGITRAISDGCDIITISYAYSVEPGDPTIDSNYWGEDFESIFAVAEAAGVAICVASGDSGAGANRAGTAALGVGYPSSSPSVISVGGTYLNLWFPSDNPTVYGAKVDERFYEGDDNSDPSFGASWGGGGGVSNVFALPDFQDGLSYLPVPAVPNGDDGYSAVKLTKRGIPDISAPMSGYVMYYSGNPVGVGGTSAAAPVMAGILARYQSLTGKRRSSRQYNKLFYSNSLNSAFYDRNSGIWTEGVTQVAGVPTGYQAATGWDPLIGLGSPRCDVIYNIMRSKLLYPKLNNGIRPWGNDNGNTDPVYWLKFYPDGMADYFKLNSLPTGQLWPRPLYTSAKLLHDGSGQIIVGSFGQRVTTND